ncbi:MAG TPA: hypothetical protein VJX67_20160 [Blastocatellia bacterium]|nr:hypothetical protein [Blastocatellia bacterium]
MARAFLLSLLLLAISRLGGQSTSVTGPVEGFVFDVPTASIRALAGSLGSSSLGPAIVSSVNFASVVPGGNYGIAVRGRRTLLVSGLGSTQVSTANLPGLLSVPEGAAWSGDGSVAVLYSRSRGWIQAFTGLPSTINASAPVSVISLGGTLSTVAVDAHGQTVVIGLTGDYAGLYKLTSPSTSFSPLLQISQPIAVAFSEDGGTVYALDASTNAISEVGLTSSASQAWPPSADTIVAIQPAVNSAKQKVLYAADQTGKSLLVYDRVTRQALSTVPVSFSPTVIEPLGTTSFVLRSRTTGSDPLWCFTDHGQPSVFFVPAVPIEADRREVSKK